MNDTNMTGNNNDKKSFNQGSNGSLPAQNASLHSSNANTSEQEKRAQNAPENKGTSQSSSNQQSASHNSSNKSSSMQPTQEREKFQSDFSGFMGEVENLLSRGGTLSAEALEASKAELSARMQNFKQQWSNLSEKTSENANHAVGVCQDYVRARPLQTVGIALGVGVLVGFLLRGSGSSNKEEM